MHLQRQGPRVESCSDRADHPSSSKDPVRAAAKDMKHAIHDHKALVNGVSEPYYMIHAIHDPAQSLIIRSRSVAWVCANLKPECKFEARMLP